MTNQGTSLLVGLLAGAASALLLMSAGAPSALSIFLFASATLPILIAGLGWSNLSSAAAVATAALLVALLANPLSALVTAATTLIPAAWIAHLANLARPASEIGGPKEATAWYPLADILMHISGLVAIGLLIMGYAIGYGPDLAGEMVDMFVSVMRERSAEYQPSGEGIAQMKVFVTKAIPAVQGAMWVIILFGSFHIASFIVRASGRSRRPKDDVPAQLRMPKSGIAVLAGGLILTFVGGTAELVGWAIAGTFATGFILSGFAIAHDKTRGKPMRGAILWIGYLAVVLFTLPLLLFLFLGLADTARSATITRSQPKN